MKTIEERAKAYVNSQVNIGTQDLCRTEGYLVGATEQKELMIEKFKQRLIENSQITAPEEYRTMLSNLLKAMEE